MKNFGDDEEKYNKLIEAKQSEKEREIKISNHIQKYLREQAENLKEQGTEWRTTKEKMDKVIDADKTKAQDRIKAKSDKIEELNNEVNKYEQEIKKLLLN